MEKHKRLYRLAWIFQIASIVIDIFCILLFFIFAVTNNALWKIFIILILAIALFWMIPMTLATKRAIEETEPGDYLSLGISTMLFQSLVAGILILIATSINVDSNNKKNSIQIDEVAHE